VVFVGTGIGGGLILNNKLYRGSGWVAGEIGHINVHEKGPKCGCGRIGCFEALASRTAVVRQITAEIKKGKQSVLKREPKRTKILKAKQLHGHSKPVTS
jgi:glucokinase